jgi:hypothetical protein
MYLILDAEQYCHYYCNDVVADELPAGALDGVVILAIKAVLSLEPLTDRFKGRQGVFNRASDK